MMTNLIVCREMKETLKILTDIAFDSADADGSGDLDSSELAVIIGGVAKEMGVTPPTEEDLNAILKELDDNADGTIDKDEFFGLVNLVIGKMIEQEQQA